MRQVTFKATYQDGTPVPTGENVTVELWPLHRREEDGTILNNRRQFHMITGSKTISLETTTPDWVWVARITPKNMAAWVEYFPLLPGEIIEYTEIEKTSLVGTDPRSEPQESWWAYARAAVIDAEKVNGRLVVTRADGTSDDLGRVDGAAGPAGDTPTLAVGETVTGAPGTPAEVTRTRSPLTEEYRDNFTIPQGEKGEKGDPGEDALGIEPQQAIIADWINSENPVSTALKDQTVKRTTTASEETAKVGADIMVASGWALGAGWSGDLASGFTHTPGNTAPLTWTPPVGTGTGTWLMEWQYDGPAGVHQYVYSGYDVHLGGGYAGITYQGAGASNVNFSRAIKSLADGTLTFTPWTEFEGRIHSVTVRPMQSAAALGIGWGDADGYRTAELRFSKSIYDSVYLGKDAGKWNYSGISNVAIGSYAMANNVTGFFNTAVGRNTLNQNINGTRNVALGYNALQSNTAGDRNVGIGPFALTRLTTGQRNLAIGVDALWRLEDGSDNIALGYLALTELRHSHNNIAIGRYAMRHTHGAESGATTDNIALGYEALGHVLGAGHIAIGRRAMAAQVSGTANVAVGDYALEVSNADQQVAIGEAALRHFTGGRNTALGHNAMMGVDGQSIGTRNVAVGDNAAIGLTSGANNTVVGPSAGVNLTDQTGNILIGFAATAIAGRSNYLNIGGLIYGDLAGGNLGVGVQTPTARLHFGANRSTPGGAVMKLSGGTLLDVPENNSVEFDGSDLYLTVGGTRYRLTKTAV